MTGESNETPSTTSSSHLNAPNPLVGSSQSAAGHSTSNIPAVSLPPTGSWPNKKADYELLGAIGVGATATVHKVRKID
jgi:hypothetical protein